MLKPFQICFAVSALNLSSLFATSEKIADLENQIAQNKVAAMKSSKENQEDAKSCSKMATSPMVLLPSQPCPDSWRFSGDFLYLMPTVDDTYFVLDSPVATLFPNGKRENNDFGFTPAFRLGAEYACCDTHREFQAFYSYLLSNEKRTVVGDHLWTTIGRPDLASSFEDYSGSAVSNLHLLYQNLDVNFSQQVLNSRELYLYIQPGIEYAYLRLKENYTYQTVDAATVGTISQKSKAWGIGPQIGLGIDYTFYQGDISCSVTHAFSVTSLFSGSILMGRAKTKNFESLNNNTLLQMYDEHTGRMIPAMHARAGLNYLIRGKHVGGSVGVGYEFNTYARALERTIFADDVADSACSTNYYNFDVQGLYVSAALSF